MFIDCHFTFTCKYLLHINHISDSFIGKTSTSEDTGLQNILRKPKLAYFQGKIRGISKICIF